jgi:Mg/Co/Ni transporter MgtE
LHKRECIKYNLSNLEKVIPGITDSKIEIYIDKINSEEIVNVLETYSKKTRRILYEISQHRYNTELYESLRIHFKVYKNGNRKMC